MPISSTRIRNCLVIWQLPSSKLPSRPLQEGPFSPKSAGLSCTGKTKKQKTAMARGLRWNHRFEISDFKNLLEELQIRDFRFRKPFGGITDWRNCRFEISDFRNLLGELPIRDLRFQKTFGGITDSRFQISERFLEELQIRDFRFQNL